MMSCVMAVALSAAGVIAAQAMPIDAGFLDVKWGVTAQEVPGLTRVGGTGKIDYYAGPQQTFTFFGSELPTEVVYGFYEGRFFAAYADVDGIEIFSRVKSYIQKRYGVPTKTSRESRGGLTTYVWRLKQAQVKLKHFEPTGKMKIAFYYLPIARQVNAAMQKSVDAEPPSPRSLLSPYEESKYPTPITEFMSF